MKNNKNDKLEEIVELLNRLHGLAPTLRWEEDALSVRMDAYYCTVGTNPEDLNNTLRFVNVHIDSWGALKRIAKTFGTQIYCRKQGIAYSYEYSTAVGNVRFFVLENTYCRRKNVIRLKDTDGND